MHAGSAAARVTEDLADGIDRQPRRQSGGGICLRIRARGIVVVAEAVTNSHRVCRRRRRGAVEIRSLDLQAYRVISP